MLAYMTKKSRVVIFMALVFASSCYFDKEEELYPNNNCNTQDVTFSTHVSAAINNKCATAGCHVAGGIPPNLTNFAGVSGSVDRIRIRAIEQRTMPPASAPKLTDCEHKQIQTWINNGAPNN
jgi:uncharacterized membrane protein